MLSKNTPFKSLEPTDKVPEGLGESLFSEVNMIRDTMSILSHFTTHFIQTIIVTVSVEKKDPQKDVPKLFSDS